MTPEDLEAWRARGWTVREVRGTDRGRTFLNLVHPRTAKARTARYVTRKAVTA